LGSAEGAEQQTKARCIIWREEPRKLIAIRLDAKVLGWLRKTAEKKGLPYQLLIDEILADAMWKAS
jgi:predicted DNA binding CopG/RHH family protein